MAPRNKNLASNDSSLPMTPGSSPTVEKKVKHRGPSMAKDTWERDYALPVEYNEHGQACCKRASETSTFIGSIARKSNILPIDVPDWTMHDPSSIDVAWAEITKRFTVDHPKCKKVYLEKLARNWRSWKTSLKTRFYVKGDRAASMSRLEEGNDSRVDVSQFAVLVERWMDPKDQDTVEGREHDRGEIWILVRTRKDGTIILPCQEKTEEIRKLKEAQTQDQDSSDDRDGFNDVLNQVGLKDRHGRLRGMGPGVTITSQHIREKEREELTNLRNRSESHGEDILSNQEQLAAQQEQLQAQKEQLKIKQEQLSKQEEQISFLMGLMRSGSTSI